MNTATVTVSAVLIAVLVPSHCQAFAFTSQTSTNCNSNLFHATAAPHVPHSKSISSNGITSTSTSTSIFSSNEFFDSLLNNNPSTPQNKCSHMIAIPLEQNHDLLLDLESIQRGILYHCPLLIGSCVAPVVMRMPLLLVDTDINANTDMSEGISTDDLFGRRGGTGTGMIGSSGGGDAGTDTGATNKEDLLTSRDPVTKALHEIVNSVVDEFVYNKDTNKIQQKDENSGENEDDREGINDKNIQPVMMKFEGLEIDGDQNEILHAIGTEDSATPLMRQILDEITARIENRGWRVYLPEDNPQGKVGGLDEDGVTWRPRIPFMRLPHDFFDTLPEPKGFDGEWENYTEEAKESYIRVPEEGGNGISPIFWYKWWEDKLCNGKGVRIRELAVYGRTGPMGVSEQAFYLPHLRTKLPDGNRILQKEEASDRNYDQMRRSDQEKMLDFDDYDESDETQSFEREMAGFKSTADRRMLETVYDLSPDEADDVGEIAESLKAESKEEMDRLDSEKVSAKDVINVNVAPKEEEEEIEKDVDVNVNGGSESESKSKAKAAEIVKSIEKPMATGDWSKFVKKKKNKPKPEDNPILKNWKQRVSSAAAVNEASASKKILTPYPSDEHFTGIWRLVSSPGGAMMDEEELMEAINGDANSSENLILRIDGTTAGGPILDVQNRHRAAGGSWRFYQAEWCGDPDIDEEGREVDRPTQTRLQVRLVIPPSKDRVLVMEGEVKRGGIASVESISKENARELFSSSSFGINNVDSGKAHDSLPEKEEDLFIFVSGEAWVENLNAEEKRSRTKLGRFSLLKRKDYDPGQYQYSIPAPTRFQD